MNFPEGQGGQGQPADQPIPFQETVTSQPPQASWPGPAQQAGWGDPSQQASWQNPVQPAGYPATQQSPGYPPQPGGYPMTPAPGLPAEPVLVSIGDISVSQTTVYTPNGSRPLSEVTWNVTDMSVTSQAIPTWAIVCAIIFTILFCGLGLLFLLAKENKTTGMMQVSVTASGFLYTTSIPVFSAEQVADVNARVNYARSVAAASSPSPYTGPAYPQQGPGQVPGQSW